MNILYTDEIHPMSEIRGRCKGLLEETVRLGGRVRREVEGAWQLTNLGVEQYLHTGEEEDRESVRLGSTILLDK